MIADIVLVLAIAATFFVTMISMAVLATLRAGTAKGWNFRSAWYLLAIALWIVWVVLR